MNEWVVIRVGHSYVYLYMLFISEKKKTNNKIIFRIVEKVRYHSFLPNTYYVYLIFAHYLCAARKKKNSIIYKDVKNVCVRNSLCFWFLSFIRFCFVSLHMTNAEYEKEKVIQIKTWILQSLFSQILKCDTLLWLYIYFVEIPYLFG